MITHNISVRYIQQYVLYISSAMFFYFLALYEGLVSSHFYALQLIAP
jgi:hypothetical protein